MYITVKLIQGKSEVEKSVNIGDGPEYSPPEDVLEALIADTSNDSKLPKRFLAAIVGKRNDRKAAEKAEAKAQAKREEVPVEKSVEKVPVERVEREEKKHATHTTHSHAKPHGR